MPAACMKRRRARWTAVVGLAIAMLDPTLAAAGPTDPAAAEALFRDARAAMTDGNYARACPKLAESQRLDPATGTLFNLADCEEHVGRLADAWEHFTRVLETIALTDERYAYAKSHADALAKRVPRLTLRVEATDPRGTIVERDGVELGAPSLGVALPVNPGEHTIVARAEGRSPRAWRVTLAEGESKTFLVSPGDALSPPPTAKVVVSGVRGSPPNIRRAAGYGVGGAGLAALAVGAFFGVKALSKKSESDSKCIGVACRDASAVGAYEDAKTFSHVADVGLGIGVVALAAGAYLVLTSRVEVAPSAGKNGASLALRIAW